MVYVCRTKDNFGETVLSFDHLDLWGRTQGLRVGGKCVYQPSRLAGLLINLLYENFSTVSLRVI